MQSFLCRVMVLVFLINCVTPTSGWGQTARRNNLDQQVTRRINQATQAAPRPADLFAQAWDSIISPQPAKPADPSQVKLDLEKFKRLQNDPRIPRDTVPMLGGPGTFEGVDPLQQLRTFNTFAKEVAENKVDLAGLMDYVDPPTTEANLKIIAYAAEVIGNTVYGFTNTALTPQEAAELEALLPYLEAHIVLRLDVMGKPAFVSRYLKKTISNSRLDKTQNILQRIEAVGSLRMALLRIGQYYVKHQQNDPANDFMVQKNAQWQNAIQAQQLPAESEQSRKRRQQFQTPVGERNSATAVNNPRISEPVAPQGTYSLVKKPTVSLGQFLASIPENVQRFAAASTKAGQTPRTPATANTPKHPANTPDNAATPSPKRLSQLTNLENFREDFLEELKNMKAGNPEPGSAAYQQLQILAEYATAYTLAYNPAQVENIVRIFDTGVRKAGDGTILPGEYNQTYSPILNAILVTVFENTRYSAMNDAQTQQVLALLNKLTDRTQFSLPTRIFALEAASLLYRPFKEETLVAPKDRVNHQFNLLQNYLNSPDPSAGNVTFENKFFPINMSRPNENLRHSMALQVADLYCSLQNIPGQKYETYGLSAQEMQKLSDELAFTYDGFYDISTVSVHAPGQDPHQDYSSCGIRMKNPINHAQDTKETNQAIFDFTVTAIFWASMLADGFALLGTAFRLTRGAVAALPRAAKWADVVDGARYNNWVYKGIKQQGYRVEFKVQTQAARIEKVTQVSENGTVKIVEKEIQAETKYVPVNHTYQLAGQRSHWNPRRLTQGASKNQEIVGWRITVDKPGMDAPLVGTAKFEETVDGLHSLKDISWAMRQTKLADGTPLYLKRTPYFQGLFNTRKVYTEQSLLGSITHSLSKTTDTWILDSSTGIKQWWNYSQWGLREGMEITPQSILFVAPKTARFNPTTATGLMKSDALADIPSLLPGFYTTGEAVANGMVYRQALNTFFKPVEHSNWISKILLPDYLPTAALWKSIKVNPLIGMRLLPQWVLRSRTLWSTVGLGGFVGLDHLVSVPFQGWVTKEAQKDIKAELAQYGDTFSPQQAKENEEILKELGVDTSDKRAMRIYQDMLSARPQQNSGALLVGPIVVARRELGKIPLLSGIGINFIDEATKANFAHQAQKVTLSRMILQRKKAAQDEYKQRVLEQNEQNKKDFEAALQEDEKTLLAQNAPALNLVPDSREKIHQVYQNYLQQYNPTASLQEQKAIAQQFLADIEAILNPGWEKFVARQRQFLHENLMQEEQYIKQTYKDVFAQKPELDKKIHQMFVTYEQTLWNLENDLEKIKQARQQFQEQFYEIIDPDYEVRSRELLQGMEQDKNELYYELAVQFGRALTPARIDRLYAIFQTAYEKRVELLPEKDPQIRQQQEEQILSEQDQALEQLIYELKVKTWPIGPVYDMPRNDDSEYGTTWQTPWHIYSLELPTEYLRNDTSEEEPEYGINWRDIYLPETTSQELKLDMGIVGPVYGIPKKRAKYNIENTPWHLYANPAQPLPQADNP